MFNREFCILTSQNALQDQGQFGPAAEPLKIIPCDTGCCRSEDTGLVIPIAIPNVPVTIWRVLMVNGDHERRRSSFLMTTRPSLRLSRCHVAQRRTDPDWRLIRLVQFVYPPQSIANMINRIGSMSGLRGYPITIWDNRVLGGRTEQNGRLKLLSEVLQ